MELAVRRFKERGSEIQGIPSIANQRVFITEEVAKVEEVAPSGGGSVHEEPAEIIEPDVIAENDDGDLDLEGIKTTEKVDPCGLRGKMRAMHEKCRTASKEVPADMLAVVALAE